MSKMYYLYQENVLIFSKEQKIQTLILRKLTANLQTRDRKYSSIVYKGLVLFFNIVKTEYLFRESFIIYGCRRP